MPDKIDKTRNEQEGEHSFVGTGVGIERVVTQEVLELKKRINEEVEQALINNDITQEIVTLIIGRQESDHSEIWEEITKIWNAINNIDAQFLVVCHAGLSETQQGVPSGGDGFDVLLDTATYDPLSMFDAGTNRIIVPHDGRYLVTFCIEYINVIANESYSSFVQSDGVQGTPSSIVWSSGTDDVHARGTVLLNLLAGNYISLGGQMSTIVPDEQVDLVGWEFSTYLLVIKIN